MKKIVDPLKSLYQWTLHQSGSPWAPYLLAAVAFTESSFFPIPPEVLLIPMGLQIKKKMWYYCFLATLFSVLGAALGYYIGHFFWHELGEYFFQYIPGFEKHFNYVGELYKENTFITVFLAAFTIIPFKVFTVAAGVYSDKVSLSLLLFASVIGRGVRYFGLGIIIYLWGQRAKRYIEENFTKITTYTGLGVLVFYILYRLLFK